MSILRDAIRKQTQSKSGLGGIINGLISLYEAQFGPVYAQRLHRDALERGKSIKQGLSEINHRWPQLQSDAQESPIFILSAGWRSGSTLVQRLIMSNNPVLVWGEPYSHARPITHLASAIASFTHLWPEPSWYIDQVEPDKVTTTFVANFYPEINELLAANIAYFRRLFAEPAARRGFARWGIKDVRLTIDDAYFLRWLFPHAKFIFLCRNPFDAYRSYRLTREWYREWPSEPTFTAREFGHHWNELASGFYAEHKAIGGFFMKYEDLCNKRINIEELQDYLGLIIDTDLLKTKVGSHGSDDPLPWYEARQLKKQVAGMAQMLGYW